MPIRRVFVSAAFVIASVMAVVPSAVAQEEPYPRILVSGEGTAQTKPDMAVLDLTVTRQATTAREALDANNEAMNKVLEAMKAEGIEDRDLQTSGFNIQPDYFYPQRKSNGEQEPAKITGYTVRNSLTVRVRDLDKLGQVLDKSVTLGVNEGGNVSFTNDNPEAALNEARVQAMRKAKEKAETLAKAADVSLGKILEISEYANRPQPIPLQRQKMATMEMAADSSVPMATGENEYSVTVSISYAIEQ